MSDRIVVKEHEFNARSGNALSCMYKKKRCFDVEKENAG